MSLKVTIQMLAHSTAMWPWTPEEMFNRIQAADEAYIAHKQREKDEKTSAAEAKKQENSKAKAEAKLEKEVAEKKKKSEKLVKEVEKARAWAEKDNLVDLKENEIAQKRMQKIAAQWPRFLSKAFRFIKKQEIEAKKANKVIKDATSARLKDEKAELKKATKASKDEEKAEKKLAREKKKAENSPTRKNAKSAYGLWRSSLAGNHYTQTTFSLMWEETTEESKHIWAQAAAEANQKIAEANQIVAEA